MAFRVYDLEKQKWIKDNIYMNPYGELYLIKQSLFGMIKVPLALDSDKYIYHRDIDLHDKENVLVFEGDYIKATISEDKTVVGLVAYAAELSSYVILCIDNDEFYTLGNSVSSEIQIIGNVFDGYSVNYKMNYE